MSAFPITVNYALWLASKKSVLENYSDGIESEIDVYYVGNAVVLSDLGYDGILFGYRDCPRPL